MRYHNDDTIAAIATAAGEAGIGIVRMSGARAIEIADAVFRSRDRVRLAAQATHTIRYGWIVGPGAGPDACRNRSVIDEVLVTVMRGPRTFTREDVVEINCHGGIVALRRVLELVCDAGARIAEPGEFTRRAFLNGRIDLSQAEAVLDVIRAKTDAALATGVRQLRGVLSRRVSGLRARLIRILAVLEAHIDFPDEDIEPADTVRLEKQARDLDSELRRLLEQARCGRVMREGVRTVICGRPNAGKSSLLNALLEKERSIVTPVAGTTRDVIEEYIDIRGIPIRIMDTAGLLEPRDLVERKAVARARECIRQADLVVLVFDGTIPLDRHIRSMMRFVGTSRTIAVINKIDRRRRLKREDLAGRFTRVVEVSAKKLRNIDALEDAVASFVFGGSVEFAEPVFVSNMRHIRELKEARKSIARARVSLDNGVSAELTAQHIRDALGAIDELLGRRFSEDLLDSIFSRFCIGK
ncbi:MAG TPA: tRNA uridine-5-carboxymethylaminomethyl(34) synthesis GTPase MnmE [Candidatus Omnitrophota bacterium]|nr:tRNA uridine-5-carboxymethylaminomethyl(34) synthesis GTPase MnmE [Candidatus Omnitrophota bacterium]HNQ50053.1 tRNA uridine-5-carboxymethylaminomethyl(34) synthesis GTPase MnmE [Candidatus Omnitrophota bacterium]HQO37294.1 tRNA uridine-5-carboxymethylaminomethyl(34) synthesis GTPase MnmE [Candidatus Omnitrophota bacterium]HQQ05808.1 tRNA uridine-5-carboxymethylaminomethyl(34) synthesis GTPase MnmE [Candidatus Omnitrophota bacterium]